MSHYDKVKNLEKRATEVEKWIRDQLIRLRNKRDPEVRQRIRRHIDEAKDLVDNIRQRIRDIAEGCWMYGSRALDGSNSQSVRLEVLAWLSVLEELTTCIAELEHDRRKEASARVVAAKTALQLCANDSLAFENPSVQDGSQRVRAVLELFPDYEQLVDCVFFLSLSKLSVNALLEDAEELQKKKLSRGQRQRVARSLESVLNAFDQKLQGLEKDLEAEDSPDST